MAALGLQIEHDDRHAGALHQRQDGIGERVGGDVEKQHVDVFAAALVAGLAGALRRIHQAQIDHLDAGARQPRRHLRHVAFKPLFKPRELGPVSIQADAAQAHAQRPLAFHRRCSFSSRGTVAPTSLLGHIENLFHHRESARRDASLRAAQSTAPWPSASAGSPDGYRAGSRSLQSPPPEGEESAVRPCGRWSIR